MPDEKDPPVMDGRLLMVSNRLPLTIHRTDDGKFDTSMSSGGLVSGLSGLKKTTDFLWYGWPGMELNDEEKPILEESLKKHDAKAVYMSTGLADKHYNGFSSKHWCCTMFQPF